MRMRYQTMQEIRVTDRSGKYLTLYDIDGRLFPRMVKEENIRAIGEIQLRDDDIFLCGMPRSGHHWAYEMVNMLLSGKAEQSPHDLDRGVLELTSNSELDAIPSPRVMTTHVCYRFLPPVQQKKIPIIHLVRDPRDVLVSHFKLCKAWPGDNYDGTFSDWLDLYSKGKLAWGSWFDHCKDWERVSSENPDLRYLRLHYEDMKSNTLEVVKTIARFLGLNVSSELCVSISNKCQFEQMKKDHANRTHIWSDQMVHFQKGEPGEWKNWFNKEETEAFSKLYKTEMANTCLESRYCQ
ncbi:sulfotransferase family cytosolic 1B member 1-like [Gigantopelta aegis]|uniref:sulfotransferase family cytosolic 1B member 1-like n=1 Tax=Gigantopelta aegis TaxID=1735272 RepID=UPI001B88CEFD|nr:sulfotransferase family cytosolic 1B member 1-like [Gigantopelta aegis]